MAATLLTDLKEGWQEFRSRTWLWVTTLQFTLWNPVVYAPVIVLGAVVAKAHLGGATAWGAIASAMGIGAIAGGMIALSYRPRRPLVAAVLATVGFIPLPVLLALAAPVALTAAAAAVGGAGFAVCAALWDTTLQQEIPQEVLSRVTIEPVYGQIKYNRGVSRFMRRGRAAVQSEWRLVAATHNLLKLHSHWIANTA